MRAITGINVHVKGKENIPDGICIIAAKHQSYGDGHVIFSQIKDLSFVTGDQLLKIPLLKQILRKMNAVVIDSCGGSDVRQKLDAQAEIIRNQGRRILIFPEGHLSQVGTHHRYRKGVWHLYNDFNCPVVPVANSLGQRWNQQDRKKFKGDAAIEFIEPIPAGMDKEPFMALLQERIESRSIALLDDADEDKGGLGFIFKRRFAPLFILLQMGTFNDNALKNALIALITFGGIAFLSDLPSSVYRRDWFLARRCQNFSSSLRLNGRAKWLFLPHKKCRPAAMADQ